MNDERGTALLDGHHYDRKGQPCCWYCGVSGEKAALEAVVVADDDRTIIVCEICSSAYLDMQS